MKKLITSLMSGLLFLATATAQTKFINRNADESVVKARVTTDSNYYYIDSLITTANESGVAEVYVVGLNTSNVDAVTGIKSFRYLVDGGTVSLGSVTNLLPTVTEAGLGTATFDVALVSNKIYIRVKGKLNTTVYWRSITKRKTVLKE